MPLGIHLPIDPESTCSRRLRLRADSRRASGRARQGGLPRRIASLVAVCQIEEMLPQNEINLIYRVLDANFNRAVEGLRAVEEYFRFILESRSVTTQIKELRHEICVTCQAWIDIWTGQRDSNADVGATIAATDEYDRSELKDLVAANLSRVNQALRTLEEYSKAACPEIAKPLELARYRFYELEKVVKRSLYADLALAKKTIYVLTSACDSLVSFEQRIQKLCLAGADLIQLREKNVDDGELLERAKSAVRICRDHPTMFLVNDRPDIALMAQADGVHVGQEEFLVADLRKILPYEMIVGVSTHSLEQARQAVKDGADYIGVGPTFPSSTKCFKEFTGVQLLQEVATQVSIPCFAIGGIAPENINLVAEAGFSRVAVSGAVHQSESPEKIIRQLKNALGKS